MGNDLSQTTQVGTSKTADTSHETPAERDRPATRLARRPRGRRALQRVLLVAGAVGLLTAAVYLALSQAGSWAGPHKVVTEQLTADS